MTTQRRTNADSQANSVFCVEPRHLGGGLRLVVALLAVAATFALLPQHRAAAISATPAPLTLISANLPAYTNDANAYNPSLADDTNYGTIWDSVDTPSSTRPIWLALDLSTVPTAKRQQVIVAWFNDSGDYLPGANSVYYNLPSSYTIDANAAAGGTGSPPNTGWVTLLSVTGNTRNAREHALNLTGYNWVRMSVTATKGSSGNYGAAFNLDLYDASAGDQDDWLFLGDSITQEGMTQANIGGGPWTGGDYAQLVHSATTTFYPIQIDGGMGGWTSGTGAQNIAALMSGFTGHYVSLAFGTNDANEPYLLSASQIQTYYSNMLAMVDAVQNAGKIAVVPYVPWGCNGDLGANAQTLNNYMSAHLATDRPAAIRGPDLWTPFSQNPSWISSDCIHPTYSAPSGQLSGFEHYQRIWEQWAAATLYMPPAAPAVSLSPSSLNLGSVAVGATSAAQSATLTNSGTADLAISAITIAGANAGDFSQTNTCPISPATLPASGTCTISVTFKPVAAGTRSASVSISDNAAGTPQSLALSGVGLGPVVGLSPGSVSFGGETVGHTSAAQTVTLTNSGTADLHISSIGLGGANPGDFAQSNACPLSPSALAAGSSCAISVTFTPTTTGTRAAAVQIADDAPGSPQSVALGGTGVAPAPGVNLSPASVSFGTVIIGNSSAAQHVTLTNSGTAALAISSIGLGGTNPGDFAQTNTCPISPATLAAGASCTVTVTFTPTAAGARSATINVSDNAAGSPQSASLSGTGQNPSAPAVSLSPTSLIFGSVNTGSTSAAQSVKLTNSGTAALSISSITIAGANAGDFAQTNACPTGSSTLAAGASCTISVTFTPTAAGARSASMSIGDNAADSPQSVTLAGTGVTPSASIFSDGFESGSLPGNWTGTSANSGNSVALDTTTYHSGTASFRATKLTSHGGDAYITKTFTDSSTVVDVRAYYYLSGFAGNGTLNIMELDTSAGYYLGSIEFVGNAGTPGTPPELYWYDGGNWTEYDCGVAPSLNAWHSFEIQDTVVNGTTGAFTLWVDGAQVCAQTGVKTAQQTGARAGILDVGSITSDTTIGMTVNVDDVVVATSRIGS